VGDDIAYPPRRARGHRSVGIALPSHGINALSNSEISIELHTAIIAGRSTTDLQRLRDPERGDLAHEPDADGAWRF
jgi:hypothetical protein